MAKVSVIIVSWNAREFLRGCLESLQRNAGEVIEEIIVVDNASSDGSPDMVRSDFPAIRLTCAEQNLGFARANNIGLKQATGDYVALINSDVVVHSNCLQQLVAFMEAHPEIGLIGPKIFGGDRLLQRSCRLLPSKWNLAVQALGVDRWLWRWAWFSGREMRHWNQLNSAEVEVLSGCFWLARTKAVVQVGGLDERFFFYAEDVDWCKRFQESDWKIYFLAEATATHFGGGSSANAPLKYSLLMLDANLKYWQKHHGQFGVGYYNAIMVLHFTFRVIPLAVLKGLRIGSAEQIGFKFEENFYSLRWLLTRRGVANPEMSKV